MTTEACVRTSTREATDRGDDCLIVEDATQSHFPQFKAVALEVLTAQGAIIGWRASPRSVLASLQRFDPVSPTPTKEFP